MMILRARIHPCDHPDTQDFRRPRQRWRRLGERLGWQGIANSRQLILAKPQRVQPIGGSPRIAYDGVAPAENPRLGALLSGSKQVAKLALAANHYRYARPTGCRNQHEVRVKVEGMRDINLLSLQVSGKPPASPHRCGAVQAAAQGKFCHLTESLEKWPLALKAAQMHVKKIGIQRSCQRHKLTLASASFQAVGHQKNAIAVLGRRRLAPC